MPPDCVDLTLDSDEERDVRSYERKRPTPDAGSDCVLVDDPDQEQKRRKSESQQHGAAAQQQPDQGMDEDNDDVVVEGVTGVVRLSSRS